VQITSATVSSPEVAKPARVPYFLRPKYPHDWRWYVGGLGRIFIATGLLMFAFVGYQLWGTGIQTAQEQGRLENQFEEQLARTTTSTSTSVTIPGPTTTLSPLSSVPVPSDVPPESTIPVAPIVPMEPGDAIAKIMIPSIDVSVYAVEGIETGQLRKGPGHFPESVLPGQIGNSAFAGHRTTFGHPFLELDKLQAGDTIKIQTVVGTYTYAVTSSAIVQPSDYAQVVPTRTPGKATLALATCHPAYTARERLVVFADLVAEDSDQVMLPPPPPTTTTSTTTATTVVDTTLPTDATSTPNSTVTDPTEPTSTTSTTSTTALDGLGEEGAGGFVATSEDAFSQGWFSDTGAIPQVILWGIILALVSIGSYYAGKRMLKLYMCFVVGFLPFTIVLYFFFQNVNRLLPPGL